MAFGASKRATKPPPGIYRDDPDRDDASSISSAVPLSDQDPFCDENDGNETPALPPYSESDLGHPTATPSSGSRISRRDYSDDDDKLENYLTQLIRAPPAPQIRLLGTHSVTTKDGNGKQTKKDIITDFDIHINLSDTINLAHPANSKLDPTWLNDRGCEPPANRTVTFASNYVKTYRGGRLRSRAPHYKVDVETTHEAPTAKEWSHLFCASTSPLKAFIINRYVTDRNTTLLMKEVEAVIRSTGYRGNIKITFPINGRKVTIVADNRWNRWRYFTPWLWWVVIILQLWIIVWPVLWWCTKKWEILNVSWATRFTFNHASSRGTMAQTRRDRTSGTEVLAFVPEDARGGEESFWEWVQCSEREWVERWRKAIAQAVQAKTKGDVEYVWVKAIEERERDFMEGRASAREMPWQQGGFVGAALGLVRGLSEMNDARNGVMGWGGDC
ncbi:hypothetical protein MMC25_007651 [Agyrium rufum]|nr:hypothetical protein [Agyrium rufum]